MPSRNVARLVGYAHVALDSQKESLQAPVEPLDSACRINQGEDSVLSLSTRNSMIVGDVVDKSGCLIGVIATNDIGLPSVQLNSPWKPLADRLNESIASGKSFVGVDFREVSLSKIEGVVKAIQLSGRGTLQVRLHPQ